MRSPKRYAAPLPYELQFVPITALITRVRLDDQTLLKETVTTTISPDSSELFTVEYRVIHVDGSVHWLTLDVRMFVEGEGEDALHRAT